MFLGSAFAFVSIFCFLFFYLHQQEMRTHASISLPQERVGLSRWSSLFYWKQKEIQLIPQQRYRSAELKYSSNFKTSFSSLSCARLRKSASARIGQHKCPHAKEEGSIEGKFGVDEQNEITGGNLLAESASADCSYSRPDTEYRLMTTTMTTRRRSPSLLSAARTSDCLKHRRQITHCMHCLMSRFFITHFTNAVDNTHIICYTRYLHDDVFNLMALKGCPHGYSRKAL